MSPLILLVGSGGIGRRHARAAKASRPDCRFVAVRDGDSDATRELDARVVPDLGQALALRPDMAIVALPPHRHAETACTILAAGVPLYLEKPVATRAADIAAAAAAAARDGIVTQVGCVLRFLPGFARLRTLIAEGGIGRPLHARLSVGQWLPDWRPGRDWRQVYSARRAEGGGVLLDLIHETDLARFFFGEFDSVRARAVTSGALDLDVEDCADLLLGQGTFTASVHLDYLDRAVCREGRIVGTEGTIAYDLRAARLDLFQGGAWRSLFQPGDFDVAAAHVAAIGHFLDHVRTRTPCDQPIADAVLSLALIDEARRQS